MKPNYEQPDSQPPKLPPVRQKFGAGMLITDVKNPEDVSEEKAAFIRNMDVAGKLGLMFKDAAGVLDPLVVMAGLCLTLKSMGAPGFTETDEDGLPIDLAETIKECAQCVTIKTVAGAPPPEGAMEQGD